MNSHLTVIYSLNRKSQAISLSSDCMIRIYSGLLAILSCLPQAVSASSDEQMSEINHNPMQVIHQDNFEANLSNWVIEQQPGGRVFLESGKLIIEDKGGCSVWFKEKLKAPVHISYKAKSSSAARVSDINCFWMASEPGHIEDHFYTETQRDGSFGSYDILQTYYVGMGGNYNATTRFRRYEGGGKRPLLPEHDLSEEKFMIIPDHEYQIDLITGNESTKYYRDGELIFEFEDETPLREGWFAFRTVLSRLEISDFKVSIPVK